MLWRVGFFPVIVLGLLAESIAKTLDQNSGLTAVWRTGMTIGIAMLIAGLSQISALREVVIQFPELVVTEMVMIILVSEFLDLRLFQDWDASLSGMAIPRLFTDKDALRIAIVRNRRRNGIIAREGAQILGGYKRSAVRRISTVLRDNGHSVERFEGDMSLLSKLREFIPPHPRTREPGGIALDLSSGLQGVGASGHVAAMLEMAGIAYAGSTPTGHFLASDRIIASQTLGAAGVRTPDLRVVTGEGESIEGLAYPVVVKPRSASGHRLVIARDREKLDKAIRGVLRKQGPEVIVEQYIVGREIEVAVLGNDPVDCLPLVEVLPDTGERVCPARLDRPHEELIRRMSLQAYQAVGARDAACVRIRLSRSGKPYLISIQSLGGLEENGTFEEAGRAAGLSFSEVLERIVGVARERYRTNAALPGLSIVKGAADPAAERRSEFVANS
jgi:D-alanine-D-alanine ligase